MQIETFSPNNNRTNPAVDQLLSFVKPIAFSWFNLQAQKRKYLKKHDSPMPLANVRAAKLELQATSPLEKSIWAGRLLIKLLKDVVVESRDDFTKCVTTMNSNTSCVPSQSDHQGKMRRIDCFKQADKIWRLDLVAVILFKGIPLENTDSERLERVESCDNILCINPYHVLITCKELDLYTSYHIQKSLSLGTSHITSKGIVLASVHSMDELLGNDSCDDAKDVGVAEGTEMENVVNFSKSLQISETVEKCLENTSSNADKYRPTIQSGNKNQQILPENPNLSLQPNFEFVRQLFPQKLPHLFVKVQQQPSNHELNKELQTPLRQNQAFNFQNDQHFPRQSSPTKVEETCANIHLEPKHQEMLSTITKQDVLGPGASRDTEISIVNHQNVQEPVYRYVQVLNPSPGMYFSCSNERRDISQVSAPSYSLTTTLTTPLSQSSSQTLSGPLFMIHPITSDTIFYPPGSGTTISLTPIMASTPHSKSPVTNHMQYPMGQFANFSQLSSHLSSSSTSSSFNLDQFLDFGQPSSLSILPPISSISSPPSVVQSIVTFTSPSCSSTHASTANNVSKTSSAKRTRPRKNCEETNIAPKIKRQRRITVTGLSDEPLLDISKSGFFSEASLSDGQLSNNPSRNFLRSDRQEGFKLFQLSSGLGISSGNQTNISKYQSKNECRTSKGVARQIFDATPVVTQSFRKNRESPSSERGSPLPMPHTFTKELLSSAQNVSKPIALFSMGDHTLTADGASSSKTYTVKQNNDEDDEDEDEGKLRISIESDDDSGGDDDKASNITFNGHRTLQTSPFTIFPISVSGNKQVMVGCPSSICTDGNNSNPVLCCFNAGSLLSPTPPFNLSSSPVLTPKNTPCSTPIPPRWCTPFLLEGDNETYPALMVNFVNLEEIYLSSESSGASSDRRSQSNSANLQLGQRWLQDGNKNEDDSEDGIGSGTIDETLGFEKPQQ